MSEYSRLKDSLGRVGRQKCFAAAAEISGLERRQSRDDLDDAADRIRAIQGRRRATQHFDALHRRCWHEREILRWRTAENGIVQAHAVNKMQHGRASLPAYDGRTLPRRGLLQMNADGVRERVGQQCVAVDLIFTRQSRRDNCFRQSLYRIPFLPGNHIVHRSVDTDVDIFVRPDMASMPEGNQFNKRGTP